uniref:Glycerol kinase 5 n=1 Tax=Parascaris univalens TaxID=6257 RepID=A0A915AND8_PARUN
MNGIRNVMKKYIIAIDVGTTTIRSCLFDDRCRLLTFAERPVPLDLSGADDEGMRAEIDPHLLWDAFCTVCREIMNKVGDVHSIASMGISCQRNTFVCWNKETGELCHKLVTWKDCRARSECKRWNESFTLKAMNIAGALLYFFTRQQRFKSLKMFAFLSAMVTHRLMVTLAQNPEMRMLHRSGKLAFGCLDTWLIYKLTNGDIHVTEPSSASSTGLFDPYTMNWGYIILWLISFPLSLLPPHTFTAGVPLALCDRRIFGTALSIGAVAGDQQAALFASGCWRRGDVSICMGTGSFLSLNTGNCPIASMRGLYPLVGWKLPNMQSYVAEGCSHDTALILKWAESIGLFDDITLTSNIAAKTPRADLCFVPAFGGLQTPINDATACCAFMGLRASTSKDEMLRAILESIAFRMVQIWNTLRKEITFELTQVVRCCGGVSSNDFICQTISTLINRPVQRISEQSFASARGVAMMAGITAGMWKKSDLDDMIQIDKTFTPRVDERSTLIGAFERRDIQRHTLI